MQYLTSGHSHGEQITVILEGMPSNLMVDLNLINQELSRRQQGYGRGGRMKIEKDQVQILGGVLFGKTTGAPITLIIKNRDYENHRTIMDPFQFEEGKHQAIQVPRPGHADLVGAMKYRFRDMKPVLERASARETVSKVAVGALCKQLLKQLDIEVSSYVDNIGGITTQGEALNWDYLEQSEVRMPSEKKSLEAMQLIDEVKLNKNTIGGTVSVKATNLPIGIGSYVTSETKLDARIAASLMAIQACKGVEFGDGFDLANQLGSNVHDEIIYQDGFTRKTNHYGGFEGGMTNGMPVIVRAVFKPIPTLMRPLDSVHIETKEIVPSHIERSDVCVVPAASVICEHVVAYELTKAICEQFTSDSMEALIESVSLYRDYLKRY
jgi:chorismate synthase